MYVVISYHLPLRLGPVHSGYMYSICISVGVFAFVLGLYWARVCAVTFAAFVMNINENEIQIDLSLVSHVPVKVEAYLTALTCCQTRFAVAYLICQSKNSC